MIDYIKRLFFNNITQAIIFFGIGLIMILSIATYNHKDPSFNLVTNEYPSNLLGYTGSYLADLLLQLFGLTAILLPICFFSWAIRTYKKGEVAWLMLKILGLFIAVSLISVPLAGWSLKPLPATAGGAVGSLINSFVKQFSIWGDLLFVLVGKLLFIVVIDIDWIVYKKLIAKFLNINFTISNNASANIKIIKSANINVIKRPPILNHELTQEIDEEKLFNLNQYKQNKISESFALPKPKNTNNISHLPSVDLLNNKNNQNIRSETPAELKQNAEMLLNVLNDFGVKGQIIDVAQGPVATLYEFEPAAGTKSSRVVGLADDIARSLAAISTRIAVIPGRNVLGIELPNKQRAFFCLKELIETPEYQDQDILLPLILGKDLAGKPYVADLTRMPHLLVAGTTGSGKSVAINTMIMSLLYRYTPDECKLIMIDPKMLELSSYDGIPHLLTPVVTEPAKAIVALKWAVKEMENRYRLMSNVGVRNIANYNSKIIEVAAEGKILERTVQTGFDAETGKPIYESVPISMDKLPFIVVIVDEMADLMIVAGKDIETSIQRLAQMARAAGIHIIMATQRPSVDVITGVIKANFPSRVSFKVTSKIDSRTILGEQGSEQLLGMGDMLYMGNSSKITRVHGPFVDDKEVEKVTQYLRTTGVPEYISAVVEQDENNDELSLEIMDEGDEEFIYKKAVQIVKSERKVSISYIQRCLRIGYNRAANIVERMEREALVSSASPTGKREILLPES